MASIVGLALALQVALVPLHLVRSDHLLPGAAGEHVHAHAPQGSAHRHDVRPAGPDAPSDHPPHPAEDHLDLLAEPATPPGGGHVAAAPAPPAPTVPAQAAPASAGASARTPCPRPPPPRDSAPTRAPPIVA